MTALIFVRSKSILQVIDQHGAVQGTFDAANNVDSHSRGAWPNGIYDFSWFQSTAGDDVNSPYGSHGVFIFNVAGREGLGVHAGRQNVADGLGRTGFRHCTMGCIRTTEEAMGVLVREHAIDPIAHIEVSDV